MKFIYRTASFWLCLIGAWVNMVLFFVARHLHRTDLQHLALASMGCFAVGMFSHWYLDRQFRKERERAQSKRRR